jgi:predicted metal-binding membrane protein
MFLPRSTDRRPFIAVMVGLIILAWLALAVWGQSPYSRYLHHNALDEVTLRGSSAGLILVFVGGWTLMTVAMMLPTVVPLLLLFTRLVRNRGDRTRLLALVIAGYLGIWSLFGVVIHIGDRLLHLAIEQSAWLTANVWILGAGTLLVAGAYQFTPLKYQCLDKCRSPLSFITERWHGSREALQSFRIGVDHGIFCVGCCWSLMLLMFVVGVGSLGWMFALATVMAVEKNVPWGKRLSTPLGIALLASGLAVAAGALIA